MAHIALFMNNLPTGGAERVMLSLARAFAARGHRVDFVLVVRHGELVAQIPSTAKVVELGAVHRNRVLPGLLRLESGTRRLVTRALYQAKPPKVVRGLPPLARYLRRARPDALLSTLPVNNLVALWAAALAGVPTRVVVREATHESSDLPGEEGPFLRLFPQLAHRWYPRAAAVVTVSNGVADDLASFVGIERERLTTIYNPVDLARIAAESQLAPDEPWLAPGGPPTLVAAGRLVPQKDFVTLLHALARVRRERPVRLVVLGRGPLRERLAELAGELGIAEALRMPGVVANPFAYLARAAAFVLSSAWEGLPNVLLEALACGCPVVATDCPSGPREILADGRYGPLVPVGDPAALAAAILATLDAPPDAARLRARAADFAIERSAGRYLEVLLGEGSPDAVPAWDAAAAPAEAPASAGRTA